MFKAVLTVGLLLLGTATAWAEFHVCGDDTQLQQAFYADPNSARAKAANCSQVPNNQVDAQLALIQSVAPPYLNPARYDYLKVVGTKPNGLAAMKSQAEKDALDAAILAQQQATQALANERATNIFCNQQDLNAGTDAIAQRKQVLYDKIDTIQAVNVATMKAGLKQVVDELATISTLTVHCFTGRKAGT